MYWDKIKDCHKIVLDREKGKKLKHEKSDLFGLDLVLLGYDEHGDLLGVLCYDWTLIKIKKDLGIEELGRIDRTLHEVRQNPEMVLEGAKVMTLKEIEEILGHKIVLRDFHSYAEI